MRTKNNDKNLPASRVTYGRAVVYGLGLDDSDGHTRYTKSDAYELYGGSEGAHREMQRRALIIREEMLRLGISLDCMTYAEYQQLQDIIDRANAGEF